MLLGVLGPIVAQRNENRHLCSRRHDVASSKSASKLKGFVDVLKSVSKTEEKLTKYLFAKKWYITAKS